MKKTFKSAMALTLAVSMMAGTTGSYVQAAENGTKVTIDNENGKVSIGNDYIAREFSIENGKIKTDSILNKRINKDLQPQTGSEDFVIRTISQEDSTEAEKDVITNEPQWSYTTADPISTEGWSATLTNGSGTAFSADEVSKLFDGSTSTYIDQWSISGLPFTLDIDFGEEKTISSMSVDKRPGYTDAAYGINGTMGSYEIWTSTDGENYTKLTQGEFSSEDYNLHEADGLYNVGDTVYAAFDEVTTRYVRVIQTGEALSTADEFTSSEIDFYSTKIEKTQIVKEPEKALDRTNWTVTIKNNAGTAFDEENTGYLTDGALSTYPNCYTISGMPITVDIDLGEEKTVRSLSIDKRPGYTDAAYGINGTMGSFELYVSDDGVSYTLAGAGEFTEAAYNLHEEGGLYNVGDRVYANFHKAYTTRYVRLVQTGVAFGTAQEFSSAELNLYEDQYVGPNWNTQISQTAKGEITTSKLSYKAAAAEDVDGGQKLTISYNEYELNGVKWNIDEVFVLMDDEPYMRSFIEISVDDKDKAQIDYIDSDYFVLPSDVEGLWCHPEESKVSSMWIGQHELMLGQPIYANGFYMGSEFPAADTVVKDNAAQIRYYSGKTFARLEEDKQLTTDGKFVSWQNVIGAAQGTDMEVVQTDFFAYIEEIATPTDFRKQYNSWYDNMMSITDASIAQSFYGAEKGLTQNGVEPLDSYVVDDGWNNYYSVVDDTTYVSPDTNAGSGTPNQTGFWEFNSKFPNELYTSSALSSKFQSTFGLWLGPQGGYNYFTGFAQYLEKMGTGYLQTSNVWKNICVGSDRYVKNLTNLFVDYEERFNIDYWKWDGFSLRPCTDESHDHMTGGDNNMYYTTDLWEKWTDLFDAARAARAKEGKGLFINATCYVNLSPWLLQWVNTIWVQDSGDTGELGTGERHEQKIYYRDQVYYQLYKQNQIQFPMKNIYNHDPIYGVSDSSSATTEVFREYLFANAVRGTAFWELYFSPSIMDDAKWKVVTDVLAWAEENHDILKNAKLFGNQPKNGVYGYSSWNGNEGIVSFTNPLDTAQTYELTMNEIVGVPKTVNDLTGVQVEPYAEGTLEKTLSYGDTLTVTIQPHETLIYQFGHKDTEAPALVSAKMTDKNTVTLKFSERIQNGTFTVNDEKVNAELKEDYRTVVLTSEKAFGKTCSVTAKASDFYGNSVETTAVVKYYKNDVITEVLDAEDLKDASSVTTAVDEATGNTWMKNIAKAYEADTEDTLSGTEDFTLSLGVKTESSNTELLKLGEDVSLSIDADGFVNFKVKDLVLSSKETVTTVTEKASGTFGTDSYSPTKAEDTIVGKINDGKEHSVAAVREANGMLKIYIDGALSASLYDEAHLNENVTAGKLTVGGENFAGDLMMVQVLNRAYAYDEVQTVDMLGKVRVESDREGWSATACSEMSGMSGDGCAMAALDGDSNSWWHTNYYGQDSCESGTHWIQIDFNKAETFDQFIYTGRGAGTNGSIKDYKLELLDQEGQVIETFTGAFSAENATDNVELGKLYTAYGVRLTAISTHNGQNFAAAVELNVSRPEVVDSEETEIDNTTLKVVIETAEVKEEAGYTAESWTAFAKALADAKTVYDNAAATQEEINAATAALEAAMEALVVKPVIKETIRAWGSDRNSTSLAVADELKAKLDIDKFETIIIATGKSPYDALAGSYLADKKQAPILLTGGKAETNEAMLAYIQANAVENAKIYILGGTSAVSEETETLLKGSFSNVTRFDGATRMDTNLMILNEAGLTDEKELLVATSLGFADSLSASATGRPILLVNSAKELNADQKAVLEQFADTEDQVYILGGTDAVSAEKEAEIKTLTGKDAVRFEGKDRYETSVKVAEEFFKGAEAAVVACGKNANAADGLCGGVLAAAMNAPLLLTKDGEGQAAAYTAKAGIKSGYVLGGPGIVSDDTAKEIFSVENISAKEYKK